MSRLELLCLWIYILLCCLRIIIFFAIYSLKQQKRHREKHRQLNIFVFSVCLLYLMMYMSVIIWCFWRLFHFFQVEWIGIILAGGVLTGYSGVGYIIGKQWLQHTAAKPVEAEPEREFKFLTSAEHKILDELLLLFEEKKIYRQCKLRISDVAALLGTNRTYVSAIINKQFGVNFLGFVNTYRIKEAQEKLLTTSASMHDIAFDVGFRNISTFNAQFKEYVGLSPSHWKQNAKKEEKE